jgi:hypothetical protein
MHGSIQEETDTDIEKSTPMGCMIPVINNNQMTVNSII